MKFLLKKIKHKIDNKITGKFLTLSHSIATQKLSKLKNSFQCPICSYYGPFLSDFPETGKRIHAECPQCGALERHRLQFLVLNEVFKEQDPGKLSLLHFAPEKFFRTIFKNRFKSYITADLYSKNVDRKEDLTCLSFADDSFDFVFASHVLEHIKNDLLAVSEIKRVLRPGGIAILPVPIIGKNTIEYDKPNPHESDHVRCPGEDYYDRYNKYFSAVKLFKSDDFDSKYQPYIYEDRTKWPETILLRPSVPGIRHLDIIPVCYK